VEAPISAGAMGEVWRGRDERLHGRPCAIKAVRLGGVTAEGQQELNAWFARESAVLSSLHHPAICDIRDVVDDADAHYLILELIDGRTLADELAARGAPGLPETEVLAWAATLCDALAYLHGHTPPVIFRDLKPQNIMRRLDSRVVLIDFGLARAMMPAGGTAIGTGGYAPPEQYQGLADARSDVYGLAATLHHLLTGRDPTHYPPFNFPPTRSLVPTLAPRVDVALARALRVVPDERFPSIDAFATALFRASLRSHTSHLSTVSSMSPPPLARKRWAKRDKTGPADADAGRATPVLFTAGRGKAKATPPSHDTPPPPDLARFGGGEPEGELGHDAFAVAWPAPAEALLDAVPPAVARPIDNDAHARVIEETLASFNVAVEVVEVQSGPTVTQFGLRPAPGVRVQRITALANDLALALAAPSIRIEAPIPGKPIVGIEIPNGTTALVTLREILESDAYARITSPLKIALGKDMAGNPVAADLARMPHLLIAGATGSGKSVCLNSLIAGLLFHNSPDRLRLLMIDPKMVELTTFNGVPHLLHPVVTEMDKVSGTLKWALKEMHRRYKLFGEAGARNITRYNETRLEKLGGREPVNDKEKPLPYIVFIIDELADLMMVSPAEIEDSIRRLTEQGHTAGVHVVLTMRPSAAVGVIKSKFPTRIALSVGSAPDSRAILDQFGAEQLAGRGDMLYLPSDGSKAMHVQGVYPSDQEIKRLVAFWSNNAPRMAALERIASSEPAAPWEAGEGESNKLFVEATEVVREYRRASVSLLQRRLAIGYSRAVRLLDQLEEHGIVGPSEDGRARVVLDAPDDPVLTNPQTPIPASAPSSADFTSLAPAHGSSLPLSKGPNTPTPPQPAPPRPGQSIQVSARILTWPGLCACCSHPAATEVAASYTRVSGKRVMRTKTRSWRVPVCAICAEHGRIYSRTTGATARAIAWSVATLVGACALGAVAGSPDGGLNPTFAVLGAIGAVALLISLLGRAQDDRRTAQGMLRDTCCGVDYPVVYQGWSGSVHSFYFQNGVYAQAFADANVKKML